MPLPTASHPDCPFCAIASACPPSSPPVPLPSSPPVPPAHLLLSTPHVIAFLDHAPISRGHVLVATRQHRVKLADASVEEGQAVGAWLGLLSRAVVGVVSPDGGTHAGDAMESDGKCGVGDWNIVQNNGARAAQVVPHVHFHIIPRAGDVPEVKARSWTIFGKGQREELDDEDAEVLTKEIRRSITVELGKLKEREGEEVVRELLGQNESTFKAKL